MNISTRSIRPDKLGPGDFIWDPNSNQWEPVQQAYWSDNIQRYVVYAGVLKGAGAMHTYAPGAKVNAQRYY